MPVSERANLPREAPVWIESIPGTPYFADADGRAWTPVGQNDGITWPELSGLFRRRDLTSAEAYLRMLREHGVTCLRLMLEYSQTKHRYFERKPGVYHPGMIQLWDDLFALCRCTGMRILLTPYDTYWMWVKWKYHPYNAANGGPCEDRSQLLRCPRTRDFIRQRLHFVTERWGGDGVIFGWDLWNEVHPAYAGDSVDSIADFLGDVSRYLRDTEKQLHGKAHLQTSSVFSPVFESHPALADVIYSHPALDFANVHLYEEGTIDFPRNTVDAAVSAGRQIAEAVSRAPAGRPVFDSEHGPIHTFKDHHKTLPEAFDDEYFRHIQWAHLASGGAGGGMRWPNRHPHSLTSGMRKAQKLLADFLPHVDWTRFRRVNLTEALQISRPGIEVFGCGDEQQAVLYLLRRDALGKDGRLDRSAEPVAAEIGIPGLLPGSYRVTIWDPVEHGMLGHNNAAHFGHDRFTLTTPEFRNELVLTLRRSQENG